MVAQGCSEYASPFRDQAGLYPGGSIQTKLFGSGSHAFVLVDQPQIAPEFVRPGQHLGALSVGQQEQLLLQILPGDGDIPGAQ